MHNQTYFTGKQRQYNPGRNRGLVEFYSQEDLDTVLNDLGEYVQKPRLICKDWAEVIDSSGYEFLKNNVDENDKTRRLKMRYRKDIRLHDFVVIDEDTYSIQHIGKKGPYMELVIKWQR